MTAIVSSGEGHLLGGGGNVMAFKAVAAQTDGDFSLMERIVPASARMPLAHRHGNCSEAFFVLDGVLTFIVDGQSVEGSAGDFLLVPRGVGHTFGNKSAAEARLLVLHAPAKDAYFEELYRLWTSPDGPPAPEAERELMSRYGMEPA